MQLQLTLLSDQKILLNCRSPSSSILSSKSMTTHCGWVLHSGWTQTKPCYLPSSFSCQGSLSSATQSTPDCAHYLLSLAVWQELGPRPCHCLALRHSTVSLAQRRMSAHSRVDPPCEHQIQKSCLFCSLTADDRHLHRHDLLHLAKPQTRRNCL